MSLAYLCDRDGCSAILRVDPGLVGVLPGGWMEVGVMEGTGVQNVVRKTHHLCPSCSGNFKNSLPTPPKVPA